MKQKKGGLGLLPVLLTLGLAPLIVVAVIIGIVACKELSANMEEDVFKELRVASEGMRQYFEYDLKHEGFLEYDEAHEYVDSLQSDGVELTLFEGDTRFMTSLRKDNGALSRQEVCPMSGFSLKTIHCRKYHLSAYR